MGAPNLCPIPADGDWAAVRKAIGVLSRRLGPGGAPHFAGLDVDVLSADAVTIPGLSGVLKAAAGVIAGSAAHADLGSIGVNDHHNQAHVLNGADHTVSGLTAGDVLTALTPTTFGFSTPTPAEDRTSEIINTLLGVHTTLDHTSGAYHLLCDAVVDSMETNTGVDAATGLSGLYSSANDYWSPWEETVNQTQGTATSNGNMGDVGGVETRYAQTFTFSTAYQCPRVDVYLNAANGSPTGNITCRIETTSGGVPTGTLISAGASVTRAAATGWVAFDFNSALQFGVAIPASVEYAIVLVVDNQATDNYFKWGRIATGGYAGGQACVSVDGGATWSADGSADMTFKVYMGGNMRLQSITFSALTQPTTVKIVILESDDTITLNEDIIAKISRDGGTTWTTAVLAGTGVYGTGVYATLYASVNVSAQPAGTSVKWRIETADEHVINIRCVALVWE